MTKEILGFCFDTGHANLVGIAKTRENKSSTDWDGFIRGLKEIHFDRVLNFETAPVLTTFPDELKAEVLAFIARIGRYFSENLQN